MGGFMMKDVSEKSWKAHSFPLGDIKLIENNIFTQNYQRDLAYLKLLDADRMLYNFRVNFGADTKDSKPLGGWDEPYGLLRGHSTGHYLSALALAYASTGDVELKGMALAAVIGMLLSIMFYVIHKLGIMNEDYVINSNDKSANM
jgi:DUF1680 family protein